MGAIGTLSPHHPLRFHRRACCTASRHWSTVHSHRAQIKRRVWSKMAIPDLAIIADLLEHFDHEVIQPSFALAHPRHPANA